MIPYTQRLVVELRSKNKPLLERVIPTGLAGHALETSIRTRFADCSPYTDSKYRVYWVTDVRWGING